MKPLSVFVFCFFVVALGFFGLQGGEITGFSVGDSVSVGTQLNVGENYPEILNVSLSDSDVVLVPNATKKFICSSLLLDYNFDDDLVSLEGVLYSEFSSFENSDDKNSHYTNASCEIIRDFGSYEGISDDEWTALGICSFDLESYSEPGEWTCRMDVVDSSGLSDSSLKSFSILELLSLGLPDFIDYGEVNSTYVSEEIEMKVVNFGNVLLDLALNGYGSSLGDGYAMTCGLGSGGIPIGYQKYNLYNSFFGDLSFSEFDMNYLNLTSGISVVDYNLDYRKDDFFNDAVNSTYWRIYVPRDVAGSCSGNIVVGAVKG